MMAVGNCIIFCRIGVFFGAARSGTLMISAAAMRDFSAKKPDAYREFTEYERDRLCSVISSSWSSRAQEGASPLPASSRRRADADVDAFYLARKQLSVWLSTGEGTVRRVDRASTYVELQHLQLAFR